MAYCKPFFLTESDDLQIPMDFRERHFVDPDDPPEQSLVQAIGISVVVSIWSPKDFVRIHFPTENWMAEKPYKRSVRGNRIDFGRWSDALVIDRVDGQQRIHGTIHLHSPNFVPTL